MRKIIALVKHMIFGWKIMAAVKIVTDWIFLFGFSFIQCHVTSFPYLDCAWGWSLQNIKWLCWSCLHCFLDFGLIHHQDHIMYKIYPSNWAITTWLNLIPTCFTTSLLFFYSVKSIARRKFAKSQALGVMMNQKVRYSQLIKRMHSLNIKLTSFFKSCVVIHCG